MKRRTAACRKKPGGGQLRRTESAEDFGIVPDYRYKARSPSANDSYRQITVTLPYINWLGRSRVTHENH